MVQHLGGSHCGGLSHTLSPKPVEIDHIVSDARRIEFGKLFENIRSMVSLVHSFQSRVVGGFHADIEVVELHVPQVLQLLHTLGCDIRNAGEHSERLHVWQILPQ